MLERFRPALGTAALASLIALGGCDRQPAEAITPLKATATIQDLMGALIDPAADNLWEAVSTEVTQAGVVEKLPRTDEEWTAVRHNAITLIEAANLLLIDGRQVAAPGKALEDAKTPGNLTAEEAQKAIQGDRLAFIARALELQSAATQALAAIDARNASALVEAGSHIEKACENCHQKYWYPKGGPPKASLAAAQGTR